MKLFNNTDCDSSSQQQHEQHPHTNNQTQTTRQTAPPIRQIVIRHFVLVANITPCARRHKVACVGGICCHYVAAPAQRWNPRHRVTPQRGNVSEWLWVMVNLHRFFGKWFRAVPTHIWYLLHPFSVVFHIRISV